MIIPKPIRSIKTIERMLASGDFFMSVPCPRNKHVFRPAVAVSVGCFSRRVARFEKSSRYRSAIPTGSKIPKEIHQKDTGNSKVGMELGLASEAPDRGQISTLGTGVLVGPFNVAGLKFLEVCDRAQQEATGETPVLHLIVGATANGERAHESSTSTNDEDDCVSDPELQTPNSEPRTPSSSERP